ncbi:NUDIX hydrolase [archaeon]|nr:NUDIX hydrolase [archaeon]MBT3451326.1 NUDIX hydrolase [archaeon]MBT6869358.1 NUDIX hydrolase [archaeon]MBT7192521.1 NUDIX hydrolase [archaeon]MBT7380597.1 NUDIX hydrolase [archaeon]
MSEQNNERPQKVYNATDMIIEYCSNNKEGIVLIERKNPPFGYALPGGFLEKHLSLGDNARKETKEETNLEFIVGNEEKPFLVKGQPDRDPRVRVLSFVYVGKGYGELRAGDDAANAHHVSYGQLNGMLGKRLFAFDHEEIIVQYLENVGKLYDLKKGEMK